MRRFAGALAVAALALAPQVGRAQDVVPRPLNAQESLKFTSGSGVVASYDNVQVGPYKADITSGNPTLPNVTLYCVDFAHSISIGKVWTADITSIGAGASDAVAGGTLGDTRLGNTAGALERYRKSAYLASLFASWNSFVGMAYTGGTFTNKTMVYSGIHAAIWTLMTAGYPSSALGVNNPSLAANMANPFIGMAQAASLGGFAGTDFNQWSVVTDIASPGTQEFLIRTQVVPEPETYVLLLSGLIALWAVARRRRDVTA